MTAHLDPWTNTDHDPASHTPPVLHSLSSAPPTHETWRAPTSTPPPPPPTATTVAKSAESAPYYRIMMINAPKATRTQRECADHYLIDYLTDPRYSSPARNPQRKLKCLIDDTPARPRQAARHVTADGTVELVSDAAEADDLGVEGVLDAAFPNGPIPPGCCANTAGMFTDRGARLVKRTRKRACSTWR